MSRPLIPFHWLPSSWGLKGKTRQRAEAEYYLEGYELELKLAEIDAASDHDLVEKKLDIECKFGKIDTYTLAMKKAELNYKDTELEIKKLEIDKEFNKIDSTVFDRKLADIKGEPWISIPKLNWNPNEPSYFELDYNDAFVDFLRQNGYDGLTEQQIVDRWLNDICRSVAVDMVQDDPTFVSETMPLPPTTKKVRRRKGRTAEYS